MQLDEAKEILNKAGYLLEDKEWLPGTGTETSSGRTDLFHRRPTITYIILHYLYEDKPSGVLGKELCDRFFNGNNDNMRAWVSKNQDYILSAIINNRRFYKISKEGIKAIKEALLSFESNDW